MCIIFWISKLNFSVKFRVKLPRLSINHNQDKPVNKVTPQQNKANKIKVVPTIFKLEAKPNPTRSPRKPPELKGRYIANLLKCRLAIPLPAARIKTKPAVRKGNPLLVRASELAAV